MARPREFDIETACEAAMNVFWDSGYKGTSLPDLLEGAKLSRGSFYKAFGSKKSVFLEALKLYDRSVLQPGIKLLVDDPIKSGKNRIEEFFLNSVIAAERGDKRGCLLCNAAVGAAHNDAKIGNVVERMFDDLTDGFAAALLDTENFASETPDCRHAKAREITMCYIGLKVQIRSGVKIDRLRQAVGVLLKSL